jgi:hypothetical protein
MKGQWSNNDRAAMKALHFTAGDVELIFTGLAARAAHATQAADRATVSLATKTAAIEVLAQ